MPEFVEVPVSQARFHREALARRREVVGVDARSEWSAGEREEFGPSQARTFEVETFGDLCLSAIPKRLHDKAGQRDHPSARSGL